MHGAINTLMPALVLTSSLITATKDVIALIIADFSSGAVDKVATIPVDSLLPLSKPCHASICLTYPLTLYNVYIE